MFYLNWAQFKKNTLKKTTKHQNDFIIILEKLIEKFFTFHVFVLGKGYIIGTPPCFTFRIQESAGLRKVEKWCRRYLLLEEETDIEHCKEQSHPSSSSTSSGTLCINAVAALAFHAGRIIKRYNKGRTTDTPPCHPLQSCFCVLDPSVRIIQWQHCIRICMSLGKNVAFGNFIVYLPFK